MSDFTEDQYRSIVPLLREQFPQFVYDAGSSLPEFLEAYYAWMEEIDGATDIFTQMGEIQEVNQSLDRFFGDFKEEYLKRIPDTVLADKKNLIKNIRDFYRAKGTERGIKLLFRILFGEDIDILYPSEQVLKPSDGQWNTITYFRVISGDDDAFGFEGREVVFLHQKLNLTGVSGTFQVGETITLTDINAIEYDTAKIVRIDGSSLYLTDFTIQFIDSLTVTGQTSAATATIVSTENLSSDAIVERVSQITVDGSEVFQCEISGVYGLPITPDTTVKTKEAPIVSETVVGMITGWEITNSGSGYSADTTIPLATAGDGSSFSASIKTVKSRTISIPGSWAAVSALPSAVLQYTASGSEVLRDYFYPGDIIKIGSDKYTVASIDDANQRLTTSTNVTSGTSFTNVVKAYPDDTDEITSVQILNPGINYTTAPTADLTGSGDGLATVTFSIGGSFTAAGSYVDERGQPSSLMKIQNDGLYQEFSYIIRSQNSLNQWKDLLKTHAHPAGMLVSGEIFSTTFDSTSASCRMYPATNVNYDNPDYESTRFYFEPVIRLGDNVSYDDLVLGIPGETEFDVLFTIEFVSEGSYYDGELFNVGTLSNASPETIDDLVDDYSGETILGYMTKYQRGEVFLFTRIEVVLGDLTGSVTETEDWGNLTAPHVESEDYGTLGFQ